MTARRVLISLILLSSSTLAAEPPIHLRAGRLSLVFEPDNAFVRYVQVGDSKVLQGISAPVRDPHWGTVPPKIGSLRVEEKPDAFQLQFDVSCRQGEIDFIWRGTIRGQAEGKLTLTFDGEARSDFLRNRIGFCVLHGPEAAGRPCVVETVDGQQVSGHFPTFIAPHQPFKNIRTISHEVADGVWATVRMEGDTFEMEDQRNWTDASFKTYCTPLELPYPVRVARGSKVSQRIAISVTGLERLPERSRDGTGPVVLRVSDDDAARRRLPGIGLRVSSVTPQLSSREIDRLQELRLDHLRVGLTPAEPESSTRLRQAAEQARRLDVALHVALHLGKDSAGELESLAAALRDIPPPATWLLIAASDEQVRVTREFLMRLGQRGRLGRGEDTNFTELNRRRPDPALVDIVSYGLNPQIHAVDNTSIIETLAIQGDTVRSARQFVGDRPLLISPITLRKQQIDTPPSPGELPPNVDPRQTTPFAAGWTLGSIKYLAEAGADRLTYFETVGWQGIMETERGAALAAFPSQPGQLFPIYLLLQAVSPYAGGYVRATTSSDPMAVVGLALEQGDRRRFLMANLTSMEKEARVHGLGQRAEMRYLENGRLTVSQPATLVARNSEGLIIKLPPYAIALVDGS